MLILASKSPRRSELLKTIYPKEFKVIPSNADEDLAKSSSLSDLPTAISLLKGQDLSYKYKDDYVISADTIVIFDNEKYGKPKDNQDAFRMLSSLNDNIHQVVTGYSIFKGGKVLVSRKVISSLILHFDTDRDISKYIDTKSPFDKAGAYGIQDKKYVKTTLLKGSMENVMGFPTKEIKEDFIKLGII